MGYRGKLREREEARRLRAEGKTLQEIADVLDVSKSSVSIWVRDVPFTASKRRYGPRVRPHPAHERKLREIAECDQEGRRLVGTLSRDGFFAAGIALYAGEGSKRDGLIRFANTHPAMMAFFAAWLRDFFDIEESRLRMRVYLHQGLDLDAAELHWSAVAGVPRSQFGKAYRAVADPSIRRNKHEFGCAYLDYGCSKTHRQVMGLIRALLSSEAIPG
jgi:transcriptional regulator with XRE-family HTH domain